jgi:putative transcriptional regulator
VPPSSHAGQLLVATPLIGDPNFERTVVLLIAHGPSGAFGVVLNRPSDTRIEEVAAAWTAVAAAPGVVFVGGPVAQEVVLGLGRPGTPGEATGPLVAGCATVDLNAEPDEGRWWDVRLFAGSAGWAPGQLEDELAEGAWWVADGTAADVLGADPDGLWATVLRRQRGEVAWFANHPDDPTAN